MGMYRIFITLIEDKVAAGAIISHSIPNFPNLVHLDYIFVNKDLQGKGIGSRFMRDLISRLRDEGYKSMSLECYDELVPFYFKFDAYTSIQPSQMGVHLKLYNFLVIPIDGNETLNRDEMKQILFSLRGLHNEELDVSMDGKFVWKVETPCK